MKEACTALGWTFIEGKKTYRWYGRFVGDYPLPKGVDVKDLGKCDHAISVPGATYEIGLVKTENGYTPMFDFYSSGGLEKRVGGRECNNLKQAYAAALAKRKLRAKGYSCTETKIDGAIQIRARKY